LTIAQLPKYLVIFVDEFDIKGILNTPIKYAFSNIDLRLFIDKECTSVVNAEGERYIPSQYKLTGMISHKAGGELSSGNYTALVKKRLRRNNAKKWYAFDAGGETEITPKNVMMYPAQILFYTQHDGPKEDLSIIKDKETNDHFINLH